MSGEIDQAAITAWARLLRAQKVLLEEIEGELKETTYGPSLSIGPTPGVKATGMLCGLKKARALKPGRLNK